MKINSLRTAFFLCVALILVGCGGSGRKTVSVSIGGASSTIAPNGTFSLTATVTNDSNGDGVTWTLNGGGGLSGTTTTSTIYTAPATVPSNPSVTITATSIADTSVSQSVTFTITQSVASTTCQASPALRGNESALGGIAAAFLVKGADGNDEPIAYAGSVSFDGNGSMSAAGLDVVGYATGETGQQSIDLDNSSYSYGSDGRGCLYLSFVAAGRATHPLGARSKYHHSSRRYSGAPLGTVSGSRHATPAASGRRKLTAAAGDTGAVVFSFAILDLSGPGRITEFDNTTGSGIVAAGQMAVQIRDFWEVNELASAFAFGADGWTNDPDEGLNRLAVAGQFQLNSESGQLGSGVADENISGEVNFGAGTAGGPLTGGAGLLSSAVNSMTGRGTGSYSASDNEDDVTYDFAYYIINADDAFVISTDDPTVTNFMISGRWLQAAAPNDSVAPSAYYINSLNGFDFSEVSDSDPGNNYVSIATLSADDTSATGTTYTNDGGEFTTSPFSGNYAFDPGVGRVVFTSALSNQVGYVTETASDDEVAAFTIGTDDNAGSGYLFTQSTSTPAFTNASLNGNFAFGSAEDVTGVQGSLVGVFSLDGDGDYNATLDEIVVGSAYSPDTAVSGSYVVNADGSGTFDPTSDAPVAFVTNGNLTLAIDAGNTPEPLLYFFLQPVATSTGAKTKANGRVKATGKATTTSAPVATRKPNAVIGFGSRKRKAN